MARRQLFILSLSVCLFCAVTATFLPQAAQAASAFYVPVGRSELMTTGVPMGEVIVANPEIADVYVHGRTKVSVIGKMVGTTTVRIFDQKSRLLRASDVVVTYDLPAIRKALRDYLPYERIGVNMVNTRVALSGNISSAEAAKTAIEIAEQYVTADVAEMRGPRKVLGPDEKSAVINLMKITAGQQVMLRIRVGEIQRTAIKNLGVSLQAQKNGSLGFSIGTSNGRLAPDVDGDSIRAFDFGTFAAGENAFADLGAVYNGSSWNLGAQLEALERRGLFKVLAEPNLVALSGEQAEFLAGGEVPIPVPQDQQTITIEYKPFGVAVRFTPLVLSENRIRIQVQPEVSEVSNERIITVQGFDAPSFNTRRASTTVELAPGEGFMIAGLIKDTLLSQIDQLPGVGEIPVLSALFRSTSFQRNETELIIAVTPYIVDPAKSGDIKMPTDDFRAATFVESIFLGAVGAQKSQSGTNPSLEGPSGFMTD
jgi:pilus assembly protein CpaC